MKKGTSAWRIWRRYVVYGRKLVATVNCGRGDRIDRGRWPVAALLLASVLCLVKPGFSADREAAAEPNVVRSTLANGLRVVIVQNRLAPVVSTIVNYLVGSNEAPAGFPGTAHAQEHMMFRGSAGLSADQLADIAANMGGSFDADTQQNITQYFYTVPAQDLDVALHIEATRMSAVDDSEAEWTKERGAIEQEVAQDHSNPIYSFLMRLYAGMYKGTPLANTGLGTRRSFDKTTAAMLKEFYDKWYAPNNAILIIVGDVEPQAALEKVRSLFSGIPSKQLAERPAIHLPAVEPQTMDIPSDLPYGYAIISFRMPGTSSPDYAACEVLGDVLSSQRGTLYNLVPEGKALFAGFEFEARPESGLAFSLAVYPKGADAQGLIGDMRQILTDDLKNGIPADLVAAAKLRERSSEEMQKNSIFGLAAAWSAAVAVEGRNSPEDDVRAMQQVTVDDVNRVARKYLTFDDTIVATLTPQPSGKPVSRQSFGGRESFAPSTAKTVPLPGWAQAGLESLAIPTSDLDPEVSTLPNGIRLIVQPASISDTVTVEGHIRTNADLETSSGQEGVDSVLGQLFPYGTATLDRIAFQKALDEIGAEESAGPSFSTTVLASHFERAVELLADNELRPALPERAFQIVKPQLAQTVAGQLESPDYLAGRAVDLGLYPKGDPDLREATPNTVSSLTLADVKNYYQRVFRPDLTTIVVIGKVTPAEVKSVVEKYFGSWTATGPKPQTDLPPVPANAGSATTVPDKSRVQDNVTLAETIGINRFSPDYYALQLASHVLGGGFYASRLSKDLRENAGLVYYVGSALRAGKTRTTYTVSYGCDPSNVSKARAIAVRDLEAMQTAPASDHEMRETQALLLRQIPLAEASVGSIAGGWLARSDLGLPLDEPYIAAKQYVNLTAAQVQAAFKKWVRPDDFVQVVQGPNPQ